MQRFLIWLGRKLFPNAKPASSTRPLSPSTPVRAGTDKPGSNRPAVTVPKSAAEHVELRDSGKHAVQTEVAGKKEPELRLEGESLLKKQDNEEEFNPYNSGSFDRSKTWESRKRK
jgi:hypothetical protein